MGHRGLSRRPAHVARGLGQHWVTVRCSQGANCRSQPVGTGAWADHHHAALGSGQPAADRLAAALEGVQVTAPAVPVVANATAEPTQDPARIRELLVQQVTAPVRWEESIQAIAKLGVTRAYELGSGSVLKGLVKRIAEAIETTTIGEPHETEAFQP